jgi:hypothetical protein
MIKLRQQSARWLLLWMVLLSAGQPLHIIVHHHQDQFKDPLAGTGIGKHVQPCLICAFITDTFYAFQKTADDVPRTLSDGFAHPVPALAMDGFSGSNISLRAPPVTG